MQDPSRHGCPQEPAPGKELILRGRFARHLPGFQHSTKSVVSQSRLVTPAAVAGVTFKA
jgi:hypothetical protein